MISKFFFKAMLVVSFALGANLVNAMEPEQNNERDYLRKNGSNVPTRKLNRFYYKNIDTKKKAVLNDVYQQLWDKKDQLTNKIKSLAQNISVLRDYLCKAMEAELAELMEAWLEARFDVLDDLYVTPILEGIEASIKKKVEKAEKLQKVINDISKDIEFLEVFNKGDSGLDENGVKRLNEISKAWYKGMIV